jgi:hypothetical protein
MFGPALDIGNFWVRRFMFASPSEGEKALALGLKSLGTWPDVNHVWGEDVKYFRPSPPPLSALFQLTVF